MLANNAFNLFQESTIKAGIRGESIGILSVTLTLETPFKTVLVPRTIVHLDL